MTYIRNISQVIVPRRSNKYIRCGEYYKIELYFPHSTRVEDYAYISKCDLTLAKQIYWRKTEYGYARGKNPITRKDILLHKHITRTSKDTVIDHINRNKLDCRRENMRIADNQINSLNRNSPCNSTTGYKGVSYDNRKGKFKSYIKYNGKRIDIGYYSTAELAYAARLEYESTLMLFLTKNCINLRG